MLWKKLAIVMLSGVALAPWLGSTVWADDGQRAAKGDPGEAAEIRELPPPPDPLSEPEMGGRRAYGPRGELAPGRPDQLRPQRPLRPFSPGPVPGNLPRGPARPNGRGPADQLGLRRPGFPGGPPRWPHQSWDALQKNDPEMYKLLRDDYDLERRTRELAIQYRRAPSQQRGAIKEGLQKTVSQHFEVRQQRRRLELKRLEEELKRLRDAIDRRNEARETIVGKRVSELLGEDDVDF
jgi:hypothetical protein